MEITLNSYHLEIQRNTIRSYMDTLKCLFVLLTKKLKQMLLAKYFFVCYWNRISCTIDCENNAACYVLS